LTGPEDSQLEIRNDRNGLRLYVNGCLVEECASGKANSVRDLRNMPEGSYTIATQFRTEGLDLHVVRKYRFTAHGQMHELQLVHSDWSWKGSFEDSLRTFQVIHDGEIVEQKLHNLWEANFSTQLRLSVKNGHILEAEVRLYFDYRNWLWNYDCQVNHLRIPECWTRGSGERSVHIPEVAAGTFEAQAEVPSMQLAPFSSIAGLQTDPVESNMHRSPLTNESLPQGVSYDPGNGTFQAIMNVHGKFVLLGEFASSDEAYQRYLEAKERTR